MTCPNVNLDSWKNLVAARGKSIAYYLWDKYEGEVPQEEYTPSIKQGEFFQLDRSKLPAAQEKLDNQLLKFLSQFGVTSKEINNFKERFGVDALGATDVMQKLIYLSSRRNITTMPEEAAHMMVMLMGKDHPLIKEAFTNIENWSGYATVKKQYMPIYNNDENKVKIEALGHLIRDAIIKKYTSENSVEKSLFQKIKDLIESFFKDIRSKFGVKKNDELVYDKQAVMKIAEGILSGDASLVTAQRSFKYSTNVDYYKALEKDPLSKNIVNKYTEKLPFKLTGSLAIAKQTNIERWHGEQIHDLDFKVGQDWVDKNGEEAFDKLLDKPNIIKVREIYNENSTYHTKSYLEAPEGYKIEKRRDIISSSSPMLDIDVYDEKGNKLSTLDAMDKIKALDFFIGGPTEASFENVTSWQDVFQGKLSLSAIGEKEMMFDRAKDQTDYINVTPVNLQESKLKNIYFQTTESEEQEPVYKQTESQKNTIAKIKAQAANIEKVEEKKESDPLLLDSEEANNYYRVKQPDGTYVEKSAIKRVTDRVKAWYKQRFGDKEFTEAEKKFNELKREYGVKYHGYFEEIHSRYFDEDGNRRATPNQRPKINDIIDSEVYDKIEKYYTELINLPELKDAAILSEVMVYDPKQKEAGTIDFLAIDKNGKAHILDWKFMYIADESKTDDVAWFKQGAYNIQLGRYKGILKDVYGIKEFGMNRAVPFLMRFQRENPKDSKSPMILKGIVAGSADKSKIENLKLMPIAEETESTGYEKLDKIIKQLNALLKQYGAQKVTDETEREFKIERMNTIRRAIRIVQGSQNIAPLIDVIEVMRKDGEKILEDYNTTYKNRPATRQDSTDKDLSDFAEEMDNYLKFSEMFTGISTFIGKLVYTNEMLTEAKTKEEKEYALQMREIKNKLIEEQENIKELRNDIREAANNFADKHIGERNLVGGLTKAEAVVQGLSSIFRGVSELPMASLKVLYKLVTLAKGKATSEALKEVEELMEIRDKIAKSGRDLKATVRQIYQSDEKGGIVNKLVYKYKKEFFDLVKEKKEEGGDKKWLLENINVEEYKKEAEAKMKENIERISKRRYAGTKEQEQETRDELILQERRRWDISRKDFNGWDNYIIKRHPKDEWLSDEYKKIKADPELLSLYNFITKFNQKAKDVGYIENKVASVFLPFVRKSMAESLAWDGSLSAIQNFSNNLQLKADDVGFGKFNEITGELENAIPKYYTSDFTKRENGVNDYSEVSEDLFKNLILYVQHVNKYKYMSEIEGQLKLVKTIEEFKGHLNTDRSGNIVKKDGKPEEIASNEDNTKTFNVFLRALLYEQKYVLSDADTPVYFSKALNGVKKLVNKVAGKEVWKEDENPSATSLIKTMDAANRAFQLKTLGLNPISGAVNMFGANIQMSTQAGRYFKSREFLKNEVKLMGMKFNEEERQIFVQSVDLFMPLKDDPSYELLKKAGMSVATRRSVADDLMWFMRVPEQLVEKAVFETLLENTMVENGRIVNIHDFVKNKYKGRTQEAGKYRESKANIEKEIEELKNTKSIAKTRKLENGKLVIPGLDLNNREELQRLTNLTRTISRNATGGLSDGDINKMSMSIWTKSMMIFRNWIPKLADTRFSEFRKVSDDFSVTVNENGELEGEKYDIGRLRLLGHVLMNSISTFSNNLTNIMVMNEKGIEAIDKMYEEFAKKYEDQTGQKMTMDRDEFADMIRTNLRNQMKELLILGTLVGTMFALGFMAPDDDDKATKNAFRYTQKVIDKFVGELSFFYNPANFEQVLSGSAFPSIGLAADFYKVMSNFFMETTGYDFTDPTKSAEEIRKKAMPVKRVVNMVPAGKSIMTWLAMIDSEFAKEYDITVQKESSIR
jgi:hypothetical protein